jgi:hypothetical protein
MDSIIAILALALFIASLGVLIVFVPAIDLIIVCVGVAAMAAWDFLTTIRRLRQHRRG